MRATLLTSIFLLGLFSAAFSPAAAQSIFETPAKKLVEFGWYSPFLSQYVSEPKKYETELFDGVSLKIAEDVTGGYVFRVRDWEKVLAKKKARELAMARRIGRIESADERFLVLYGASQMDWFSDDDWAVVENQIEFAISIAKASGCVGILWDPEPYGSNPWKYDDQPGKSEHSFDEYEAVVRRRGAQFMRAIQSRWPDVILFSLRELSDFQSSSPFSAGLFPLPEKKVAKSILRDSYWSLHIPFIVGMFEAIERPARVIDGNEEAYYYTSAEEYDRIRTILQVDALVVIPQNLRSKYRSHFELGQAVASNYVSGDYRDLFKNGASAFTADLKDDQRLKWMEHNVYHALRTSDEYAWFYSEDKNYFTGKDVPAGFPKAIMSARQKIQANQSLGFEVNGFLDQKW